MKKLIPLLMMVGFLFHGNSLFSQLHEHRCASEGYNESLDARYPGFEKAREKTRLDGLGRILEKRTKDIYRIAVVVHVVYHTEEQNLSEELIHSQIEVLNQAYRRTNPDTVNTPEVFKSVASDAGIEFYLPPLIPKGTQPLELPVRKPIATLL